MMSRAKYEVDQAWIRGMWQVVSIGPRGGKRHIASYRDEGIALGVANFLNQFQDFEGAPR